MVAGINLPERTASVGFRAEEFFQAALGGFTNGSRVVAAQVGSQCEVRTAENDDGADEKKKKLKHSCPHGRVGC